MSKLQKGFFITFLLILVGTFSYSMILEVAGYYKGFYPKDPMRGWFIAVLPESAMLVLMAVSVPVYFQIPWTNIKIHYINIIGRVLVTCIFVITVVASGLYVLKPSFKTLSELNRETALIDILEKEGKDLQQESKSFEKTKQKVNLALTAKAKRANRKEYKELMRNQKSSTLPVIEITLIFILRVVIQMANLVFAFLIGYVYRQPSSRIKSTDEAKKTEVIEPEVLKLTETAELDELEPIIPEIIEPEAPALKAVPKKIFNNAVKGYGGRFASKIDRSPP